MSFRGTLLTTVLRLVNFKKILRREFENPPRTNSFFPKKVKKRFEHKEYLILGRRMVTLLPKSNETNKHFFFFHGGNYTLEMNSFQWDLVCLLAKKTNSRITIIDYPLAPEHNYRDTFSVVEKMYAKITQEHPSDEFILIGDSAGGGLAFAFAQKLRNESHAAPPSTNILLSPLLDVTLTNPEIGSVESLDVILSKEAVIAGCKPYADGDASSYLVSPIYGDLENLGKTLVFFGTHELFYPDCKKLERMCNDIQTTQFQFFEYPKMPHDFMTFPIPEMKSVVEEIKRCVIDMPS